MSSFHFSCRLNERKLKVQNDNKKMAYLIDLKTVCVGKCITI